MKGCESDCLARGDGSTFNFKIYKINNISRYGFLLIKNKLDNNKNACMGPGQDK